MRLSCNGCRVLRKGCSDNCSIRPCLDWIESPEAQANATLFLAKFYGRAGLLNLINAGPDHHRPSIFKSLLHEACGRIVNPVHGSAGLYSTGSWQLCQAAVEAVLRGSPISQMAIDDAENSGANDHMSLLLKACDIRHVAKEDRSGGAQKRTKQMAGVKRVRGGPVLKPKVEVGELATESSGGDSVRCDESRTSRSGASEIASVDTVEDTVARPNGLPEMSLGLSLFPILEACKEEDSISKEEEINGCDANMWACDLSLGLPLH